MHTANYRQDRRLNIGFSWNLDQLFFLPGFQDLHPDWTVRRLCISKLKPSQYVRYMKRGCVTPLCCITCIWHLKHAFHPPLPFIRATSLINASISSLCSTNIYIHISSRPRVLLLFTETPILCQSSVVTLSSKQDSAHSFLESLSIQSEFDSPCLSINRRLFSYLLAL